eukprot:scaffold1382_cov429-Prasinococcus_capsulatus_cf.AAC.2
MSCLPVPRYRDEVGARALGTTMATANGGDVRRVPAPTAALGVGPATTQPASTPDMHEDEATGSKRE